MNNNSVEYSWFNLSCIGENVIGQPADSVKFCRFCKKPYKPEDFSQRSHVVSESLGNKAVISSDECNSCNNHFSKIEQDFFIFNKYFLILDNIKGKNNTSPCFNQGNFKFYNSGNTIVYQVPSSEMKPIMKGLNNGCLHIERMGNNDKFRPLNVHKALVKFAISILPISYLHPFDETIHWLNIDGPLSSGICLPPVFHTIVDPVSSPTIKVHIQTSQNHSLPYAWGEFQCASIKYIFVLPFTSHWDFDFSNAENMLKYGKLITQITSMPNITRDDLSSYELHRVKLDTNILIESSNQ